VLEGGKRAWVSSLHVPGYRFVALDVNSAISSLYLFRRRIWRDGPNMTKAQRGRTGHDGIPSMSCTTTSSEYASGATDTATSAASGWERRLGH
jgi:hypothetical protein